MAVAALVTACSSEGASSSGSSPPGSSSGSSGATPEVGSARCVGNAVDAYTLRDPESCRLQDSDWRQIDGKCRGTTFVASCARMDRYASPEELARKRCLDIPGCGFTESDGSITKPSGRCEGTKTPCGSLSDEASCRAQPGCSFSSSRGCEARNGIYYLDNADCPDLQISDSVSFSVVRGYCERVAGCRWVP